MGLVSKYQYIYISLHNNVIHVVVAPNMVRCTSYMEPYRCLYGQNKRRSKAIYIIGLGATIVHGEHLTIIVEWEQYIPSPLLDCGSGRKLGIPYTELCRTGRYLECHAIMVKTVATLYHNHNIASDICRYK